MQAQLKMGEYFQYRRMIMLTAFHDAQSEDIVVRPSALIFKDLRIRDQLLASRLIF
jgi:hypothetical protein